MNNSSPTRVILVRHGQSTYNQEKRIQGRSDLSVLTEKGQADARLLGQTLAPLAIASIYTSPLQRAQQTAAIIQTYINAPLKNVEDLREIDLPPWEGLHKDQVKAEYPDEYYQWKHHPAEFTMTREGQTFQPVISLFAQARRFWQELPKTGETILIVAHNAINRALLATALGIPPAYYHHIQQSNCCINVLNFLGQGGVQLESLNQTAHLGEALPKPREGDRGLRLLLVRHGETQWNRETRFQGQIDVPLNDHGQQQAQKLADLLASYPIDLAVSSPMLRPRETAAIVLKNHPQVELQLEPALQEINHGLWEGKLETEIQELFPAELAAWRSRPEQVQMPGGENLQQVWDRAIAAWQSILNRADWGDDRLTNIMVVAHDAINKVILCHLMGLSPAEFWQIKQGNGGLSIIDYPEGPGGMAILQAVNITTHLSGTIVDQTAAGAL